MQNNQNKIGGQSPPLLIKDKDGQYKFMTAEGDILLDDYLAKHVQGGGVGKKFAYSAVGPSARQKKAALEAIEKSGANVSEEIKKRLEKLLVSFLKEVRGEAAACAGLTRPVNEGGAGLDSETADKIIVLLKKELAEHQAEQPKSVKDAILSQSGLKKEPVDKVELPVAGGLDWTHELAPPPPMARADEAPRQVHGLREGRIPKPLATISKPIIKEEDEAVPVKKNQARRAGKTDFKEEDKVKVADIKFRPHLMGPLDELKNLDLEEFRRLARDPAAAARKIKEKIDILEDDSFTQKIKAIKAWRESKLNGLYLALGEEGMEKKEPIKDIIGGREKRGEQTLNEREFEAIMELNRQLRGLGRAE